ncbi:hypothetical protein Tco_0213264 [Tanacetum coccineum]
MRNDDARHCTVLILSLEMRVPSIDIYHRIRNPSMDEKVELQYRLHWLTQRSISKVPQSMVDASLELYHIPYSMLKLLCLLEPKKKAGRLGKPTHQLVGSPLVHAELCYLDFLDLEESMTLQLGLSDPVQWRPRIATEYSAVASIVRNASDHLRPFLIEGDVNDGGAREMVERMEGERLRVEGSEVNLTKHNRGTTLLTQKLLGISFLSRAEED